MTETTPGPPKPRTMNLRFAGDDAPLYDQLAAFARDTHRSMNKAAIFLIDQALTAGPPPAVVGPDVHLR